MLLKLKGLINVLNFSTTNIPIDAPPFLLNQELTVADLVDLHVFAKVAPYLLVPFLLNLLLVPSCCPLHDLSRSLRVLKMQLLQLYPVLSANQGKLIITVYM